MTRPLRILYHHRIRADDGQAVHVRELITALRRQGHQVLECALVPKAAAPPAPAAAVAAPRSRSWWQRVRLPRTAVEVLEILYSARGRARLLAAGRTFRPDVIYERHALHCRSGLDAARELGVPLLLEVNSPMCQEMRKLGLLRFPKRAAATERAVLQGAQRVLAVTGVLADLLQELGAPAERLQVIPNGAQPERYDETARAAGRALRTRLGIPADGCVLGFVGYMRPWHRLDLALEVMAASGGERLHLLLVGTGPALPSLQDTARARGLGGRLHAVGEVAPDLLPPHVLACDAALIPAINAYASPLKLFDSLAAGVATLAPDQPNLRELLEHGRTGILFEPGSAGGLRDALLGLLRDPARAARIGAAGREELLARRWTWDGNAARVAAAARDLLGGGR